MSKDKNAVIDRIRNKITPEQRELVRMNLSIARQIDVILKSKGWSQKEFAKQLAMQESAVSRILSGIHNFSQRTVAKITVVLGQEIITTPLEACEKYKSIKYYMLPSTAKSNKMPDVEYNTGSNIKVTYRKQTSLKAS